MTFLQVFEVMLALILLALYSLILVMILPIYLPILWWEKTRPDKLRHAK